MKKKLLMGSLIVLITGCGTMMEPSRKSVSIQSETPVMAYSDGNKFVGEGKYITFDASNRSRKGDEYVILKEVGNEENTRTVYLEREVNAWSFWNFMWYGIPYIIDLPTGGTGRLGRVNYQVPSFGELDHGSVKTASGGNELEQLRNEIEMMKLKDQIKSEMELERATERTIKLEASK